MAVNPFGGGTQFQTKPDDLQRLRKAIPLGLPGSLGFQRPDQAAPIAESSPFREQSTALKLLPGSPGLTPTQGLGGPAPLREGDDPVGDMALMRPLEVQEQTELGPMIMELPRVNILNGQFTQNGQQVVTDQTALGPMEMTLPSAPAPAPSPLTVPTPAGQQLANASAPAPQIDVALSDQSQQAPTSEPVPQMSGVLRRGGEYFGSVGGQLQPITPDQFSQFQQGSSAAAISAASDRINDPTQQAALARGLEMKQNVQSMAAENAMRQEAQRATEAARERYQQDIAAGVDPAVAASREAKAVEQATATPDVLQQAQVDRTRAETAAILSKIGATGRELNLTPAQEARDKAAGQALAAWDDGGRATVEGNISSLGDVIQGLETGQIKTRGFIDALPFGADWARAIMNPEAQDAKDRVQGVIFQTLRETLGAQFTEREGQRLVEASYNAKLSPEQNAARLRDYTSNLQRASQARETQLRYLNENGTLQGYQGPNPEEVMMEGYQGGAGGSPIKGDVDYASEADARMAAKGY